MNIQMQTTYDVVVIGSGFGGAINACRLAQAGRSVCVLERGKRWGKADFPRTNSQLARAFWNPTDLGLLDYRVFRRVDVIAGVGVGGGSLVYFNVNRQPPASIFENPRWPRAIKKDMLQPYYEMSRAMLEAKPLEPPAERDFPLRKKAFFDAVKGSGRDPILMNIAVLPDRNARILTAASRRTVVFTAETACWVATFTPRTHWI